MTYIPPDIGPSFVPGLATRQWQTPGGNVAAMTYRQDTSDWNTVSACLRNPYGGGDEYGLPAGLSGWGLDVGAHIGSVVVGLLLDNPDMSVVAIEAVPDNVELVRTNLEQNGVAGRCVLLAGAAWKGKGTIDVEYGYTGSETAEVHRYIGSISPWMDAPGDKRTATVPVYSLADALRYTDGAGFVWAKTDCEGCEHYFFKGAGLRKVGTISGEWHRRDGDPERFVQQLNQTHEVQYSEGIGGGPFKAVPR